MNDPVRKKSLKMNKIFQSIAFLLLVFFLLSCQGEKQTVYNITDFGAVADSLHINTEAIQKAIDKCADNGGGTVVIPSGTFLSGAIFFKQGVNLEIKENGVLKGTTNMADYKLVQTRWEGEERIWISALVNVFNVKGFRLFGNGTIDGSGDVWFSDRRSHSGFNENEDEQASLPNHVGPVREGKPALGPKGGLPATINSPAYELKEIELESYARPRLIAIQNCQNVEIKNLTFINQSSWGLFVLYSSQVEIRDLVIRAEHYIPSSDGIDIDSSSDVKIVHVDIDVNDDCIAIKSGKDEDGRRVNRPAENILVDSCIFRYGHGGVSMGSEMSGGIRNVVISNSVMMADNWAPIRFKSQPSRGGVVENITYRNLILDNTRQAFEFNMKWRMKPPIKAPSDPLPVVRDVKIINVRGTVRKVGIIRGLENSPIENVTFENCEIKAQRGLVLENVKNIGLTGLKITVDEGEPVIWRNVSADKTKY
jgi:polygalacturonase